ncbi:MAG: YifB family Mg chelatase-like AAA ATPase [Rhizobiales bacterium]|nr:YifB family Mg chelatase-like AAA ATPase [Hyphomicrobiales bacterium]NRB15264.1 YifB family Mg chelatase-like AAA ATPase [Hyphomicrobiales bacterium]
MVAHIKTVTFLGTEALAVDVQVQISSGMPAFNIVGLPDKAVAESRERVRAALGAVGLALPPKRITINLAPGDLPKEGSHFDLPIALGLMAAAGIIPIDYIARFIAIGELSLDGSIAKVGGSLPTAMFAHSHNLSLICPAECGPEAAWAGDDFEILAPHNLISLMNHIKGEQVLTRPVASVQKTATNMPDLRDIRGQETAKRALEITAAGGHNMLMVGPPGAGKSMLASRLSGILPVLETSEMLETSIISSVAGNLMNGQLSQTRPFRAPHHSASMAALIGGGSKPKPGEISLAHRGVLFLDELPEFAPRVLDSLRQPLETGEVLISRANYHVNYPAKFQLIAAMNPCKCGMAGQVGHVCKRGARCADDYQARLSGPLLDRIDIHIHVPAVSPQDLSLPAAEEGSLEVAKRVADARQIQTNRFKQHGLEFLTNSEISPQYIDDIVIIEAAARKLLLTAADKLKLSARAYHRVIRLSRTIADIEASEDVCLAHIAEALNYRSLVDYKAQAA